MARTTFLFILLLGNNLTWLFSQASTLDSLWSAYITYAVEDSSQINILNQIATELIFIDSDSANAIASQAVEGANQIGYNKGLGKAYETIGILQSYKGNHDKAEQFYRLSLKSYEKDNYSLGISDALLNIAKSMRKRLMYDSAMILCDKSLDLLLLLKDSRRKAENYYTRGIIYRDRGEYQSAIESTKEALLLDSLSQNEEGYLNDLASLADIYLVARDLDVALHYALPTFERAKKANHIKACYYASLVIGAVYRHQRNYKMALKYLEESLSFVKKTNIAAWYVSVYGELALVYELSNDYTKAINTYDSIMIHAGGRSKIALYNNRGILYLRLESYQNAINDFKIAIQLAEEANEVPAIIRGMVVLSMTYKATENYDESVNLANKAYLLSQKHDHGLGSQILSHIAEVNYNVGNGDMVYEVLTEAVSRLDSVMLENSKVQQSLLDYEMEKKDQEKEYEILNKEKQVQRQRYAIVMLILSIGMVGLIARLFYQKSVEAKKRKELIETSKKDIHHRIKNDVQSFSAIINMQASQLEDGAVKNVLGKVKDRIVAMGKIHSLLINNKDDQIELGHYLEELIETIRQNQYLDKEAQIEIKIADKITNIKFKTNDAANLGIIINEIITNSFKYAFKDIAHPKIVFSTYYSLNDSISIEVADNGCGIPEQKQDTKEGQFGISMVKKITKLRNWKLNSSSSADSGTKYLIEIPYKNA